MGLGFTGYHYKIDETQIDFEDPNEPWLNNNLRRGMFIPDASFGVYLLNARYSVGFSASELFEASTKIGIKLSRISGSTGIITCLVHIISVSANLVELQPSFLLAMSEQLKPQADIGCTYIYEQDLWTGLAYRTSGAIIANVGVKYQNMYIGYAFDFTLQRIQRVTYGTHELTFAVKLGDNTRKYRWIDRY